MKKRTLFISIGAVILAGALVAGVIISTSASKRKNTTVVGFYDLSEECKNVFTQIITEESNLKFTFVELTEKELTSKNLNKKVDLLLSYNSRNTSDLAPKAINIPEGVLQRTPSTIKQSQLYTLEGQPKIMPVATDIFEVAMLDVTTKKYDIPVPTSLRDFSKYGHTASYYYVIPFFIAGEVDENINSLFTLLVQTFGGKEAYFNMLEQLKNTSDFSQLYDMKIGGKADENVTVSTLLNVIKEWQDKEYLTHNWTTMSKKDTELLIEDNRVAIGFMNLSEHRTKPMPNAKYFKMLELPCNVQPVITAMGFTDSEAVRIAMNRLSLPNNQEEISMKTRLGPAMLQGTSYDIQADDARYYAAATEAGPVPDLGTAALKTKEQRHQLAEAIRNYF